MNNNVNPLSLSDECLVVTNDDSGHWANITDNDNDTCNMIPRDGVTNILQHMYVDTECVANKINPNISSVQSLLYVTTTWRNLSSCPDQKFLFAPKIQSERTCETDVLKPCGLIADNISLNSTCEYTCPCAPTGNRCLLYFIQAQYSDTPMETSNLCEMKVTAVSEL